MAQKIVRTDDIDGSDDAKAVVFSHEGITYEIDLSERNAQKLADALKPFKEAGHRVAGSSVSKVKSSSGPRPNLDDIRKWARENGYTVSDRGRVAQTIIDAYDAR